MKILNMFNAEQQKMMAEAGMELQDREYSDQEIQDMYAWVVQYYHFSGKFNDEIMDKASELLDIFDDMYPPTIYDL